MEARLGKMERASRTTSRRPWVAGRRLEEAAPRRGAAGGELSCDGGAPAGKGWRAWADELHWDSRIPFPSSVGAEAGGRRGSVPRRRLAGGAGMGRPGLGASVGGEEGGCGIDLG